MTKKTEKKPSLLLLFFYLLTGLSLGIHTGCQSDHKIPADLLNPKVMAAILTDLHIAEAYIIESRYNNEDSARVHYYKKERAIFKKYSTDSLQYAKSYTYYSRNTELLSKVYQAVVDTLSYRESVLQAKDKEKIKKDSTTKLNTKYTPINKNDSVYDISPGKVRQERLERRRNRPKENQ